MIDEQTRTEARARVFWGEEREKVLAYLRDKGMSREESRQFTGELFEARIEYIKGRGIRKMYLAFFSTLIFVVLAIPMFLDSVYFAFIWGVVVLISYEFFSGLFDWLRPHRVCGDVSVGGFIGRWFP